MLRNAEFKEQLNDLYIMPQLEEIAATGHLTIDPAELIMATYKHNLDAENKAAELAKEHDLLNRFKEPRFGQMVLSLMNKVSGVGNIIKLEEAVVGQRFRAEAITTATTSPLILETEVAQSPEPQIYQSPELAILANDKRYVSSATGVVSLHYPKSFRTGKGTDDFNLYGRLSRRYVVRPFDAQGSPLITLTTK